MLTPKTSSRTRPRKTSLRWQLARVPASDQLLVSRGRGAGGCISGDGSGDEESADDVVSGFLGLVCWDRVRCFFEGRLCAVFHPLQSCECSRSDCPVPCPPPFPHRLQAAKAEELTRRPRRRSNQSARWVTGGESAGGEGQERRAVKEGKGGCVGDWGRMGGIMVRGRAGGCRRAGYAEGHRGQHALKGSRKR